MTEKEKELLEENGWCVECEMPFEIRHEESNSFATGWAADIVLESLKPKRKKK